jgi:hypothetical protein
MAESACLNILFTYFHFVFTGLESREPETYSPVHVINIDIQDNHEEATLGAFLVCNLCEKVYFVLSSFNRW